MLDKPEKTRELVATLKAAAPFEVALTQPVVALLRSQENTQAIQPRQIVVEISYIGDGGGVMCRMQPRETENAVVLSLTHIRVHRSLPFAAAVLDYQKHRAKKLKKYGNQ